MFYIALLFIFSIALSLYNLNWGIPFYLLGMMVTPYLDYSLGIHLSFAVIPFYIFLSFIFNYVIKNNCSIDFKIVSPFLLLYIPFLFFMPFQSLDLKTQFTGWLVSISSSLFLPIIMANILNNKVAFVNIKIVMIVITFLITLYGIFVFVSGGINPYQIYMAMNNNVDLLSDSYYLAGTDRVFGRNSSLFDSPQAFGVVLCFLFVYLLSIKHSLKTWLFYLLESLVLFNSIFCGVRTVVATLLVVVVFLLLANLKKSNRIFAFIIIPIVLIIGANNDLVYSSFANVLNSTDGSSVSMRSVQLEGCFNEISDCFLLGKGYGWTGDYRSLHGDHPVIIAFESLLFIVLCNSGVIGLVVWAFFIYYFYSYVSKIFKDKSIYLNSLLVAYLSYTLITGDYGYVSYFAIFYVIIYYSVLYENKSKDYCLLSTSVSSNTRK